LPDETDRKSVKLKCISFKNTLVFIEALLEENLFLKSLS
jgi:hypothetical protein